MKITEIITNPPRDEYLDRFTFEFGNAESVAKIKDLTLKKAASSIEIHYGLFDPRDRLVGYLGLSLYKKDLWQVDLVQLAQAYKGIGYGTFLYDYAIMNDKLKVLSDKTNTGGPYGSKNLWQSLYNKKRYNIIGYDTDTDSVIQDIHPGDVYNEKPNIRWLALPPNETINEALTRIQSYMRKRYVAWYGPGTTTEEYFNY